MDDNSTDEDTRKMDNSTEEDTRKMNNSTEADTRRIDDSEDDDPDRKPEKEKKPRHTKDFEVPFWWSSRMGLAFMGCLGFMIFHSLQVHVNPDMLESMNITTFSVDGHVTERRLVIDSYYWGYILTQLPGALFTRRYGAKDVIGWSMMATAIATLLTPVCASIHYGAVIIMRIVGGMFQGAIWPSFQHMFAYWLPPSERSRLAALTYSGTNLGYIVAFCLCRALCADWTYAFHIIGAIGVVWFIFWLYVVKNSPDTHPRITVEEKDFLIESIMPEMDIKKEMIALPWLEILSCRPVWAIIVANVCCAWGNATLIRCVYEFIEKEHQGDQSPDLYTWLVAITVPYVCFWMVTNGSGWVADIIRQQHGSSSKNVTTVVRKVFNSIGCLIPAICIVLVAHLDCGRLTSLLIAALGVAMMGCQYGSGYIVNQLDLAPRHAGTIMGISNTLGALSGYLALVVYEEVSTQVHKEPQNLELLTLDLAAVVYILGTIFYIIFGSSDVQPWTLPLEEGPVLETHIRPRRPHREEAEIL